MLYLTVFILRRVVLPSILTLLIDYPAAQVMALHSLNILDIICLGLTRPFQTKRDNLIEFASEFLIGVSSIGMFTLTPFVDDFFIKFEIGWVQTYITALLILGHISNLL